MRRGLIALAIAGTLALTGCTSNELGDRGGDEGAAPDRISDVDYIEVFRNVDNFPNVAMICVDGVAFAGTASREGYSAPSLIRVPEWDSRCPGLTPPNPAAPSTPAPAAS